VRGKRLTIGLLLAAASPLAGQAVMSGIVREDSSGRPLAGVEVLVEGTKLKTVSDNGGRYVLGDLPAGDRVALFRFVGYRGVRQRLKLIKGDTTRVDAVMVPDRVRELEAVEVTGTPAKPRGGGLESFEERRALGFGKFIDSTELRRYQALRLADVLRRQGLTVARFQDPRVSPVYPRFILVAVNRHKNGPDGKACPMQIVLDGTTLYSAYRGHGYLVDLSEFLAGSLAAVEVYSNSAETPAEFTGAGDECGTIVIWTRRK
jgi:carboxypeptidase family protein